MLKPVLTIASLALVAGGLLLVAFYSAESFTGGTSGVTFESSAGGSDNVAPTVEDTEGGSAGSPEDKTLKLTVPEVGS